MAAYRKRREGAFACALCGKHPCSCKPVKMSRPKAESKLELRFAQQLADRGIWPAKSDEPMGYMRNYFPINGRNWEIDFAWPALKVGVEVDGMAHRTRERFKADMEKHAHLLLAGWRVLRVCGDDVRDGRAIVWTMKALEMHQGRA